MLISIYPELTLTMIGPLRLVNWMSNLQQPREDFGCHSYVSSCNKGHNINDIEKIFD